MSDLICRKTMMRCQTPGMCAPYGGCRTEAAIPADQVLVPRELLERITAYTETLYDCEQRVSAIDELRTIVHAAAERAKSNQA